MTKEIFDELHSYFNMKSEINTPMVTGGGVYKYASDKFHEGCKLNAFDGKSWESCVGVLLGDTFAPYWSHLKGINMLPSGIACTSLLNTIANMWVSRNVESDGIIMLGDDCNVFNGKAVKAPWMEYQKADSDMEYILGVSYKADPLRPRLSGLKVSSDRATLARPMSLGMAGIPRVTPTLVGVRVTSPISVLQWLLPRSGIYVSVRHTLVCTWVSMGKEGYSMRWPGLMPGIISAGHTLPIVWSNGETPRRSSLGQKNMV
jgi:hypothetical protein